MRLHDPAYLLAAARAQGLLDATAIEDQAIDRAQQQAHRCGRRLVECAGPIPPPALTAGRTAGARRALALGWLVPPVPEETAAYPVRRLSPTQSLTFAMCLSAAWADMRRPPYPGEAFTRAEIIDALIEIGADSKAVKDALDTELPLLLLVYTDGGHLHLGPAVAGLPDTFAEAMRRLRDHLPQPPRAAARDVEDDEP
ncbi:hypothetical protein [Kitasatospora sp. LaBMicrA B282]|uniref:hypothetical protein n=1 Tax=Kitasatospora sp. LaBMicrA B282 TaxID=3420949 RepID=UPI003D09A2D7